MNRPHITLALGGGGARGVAHLGVIEVLDDAGYSIERIFGISIGSLVGALYAFDPDIDRVQKRTLEYLLSPSFQRHQQVLFGAHPAPGETATGGMFNWYSRVKSYLRANRLFHRVLLQPSLLPGIILQEVVDHLLPDVDIADAKIPLCVVAVDLRSGKRVVLEKGSLRSAVCGSSSLPGIFPPVEHEDMLLCDVGVLYSLPTTVARPSRPELLVAVDVSSEVKVLPHCETALDVLMRMDEVGESLFRDYARNAADHVIRPQVSEIEWFDFSAAAQIMEAGRVAARAALAELPMPLPRGVATEDAPPLERFRRWFAGLVR